MRKEQMYKGLHRLYIIIIILCLFFTFIVHNIPADPVVNNNQYKNSLRIAILESPQNFNYLNILTNCEMTIIDLIYEPMSDPDPTSLEPSPLLAKKWEWDPSSLKCIVTLRENVTWHDGKAFTAHDIKFWFDMLKEYKIPKFFAEMEYIKAINVEHDNKVCFQLSEPNATLPFGILVLPRHHLEPVLEIGKKEHNIVEYLLSQKIHPVGCGLFKFSHEVPGSHIYLLANKNYYLGGPHIDGILFKTYNTIESAITGLVENEVDYIYRSIDPGHIPQLKKNKTITIQKNPTKEFYCLAFNLKNKIFSDISFRKAIAFCIDKEIIIEKVFKGYAEPLYSVIPKSFTSWYNKDVIQYGKNLSRDTRIANAKKILMNAGYTYKDNKLILPDGKEAGKIDIITPTEEYDVNRVKIGLYITQWLKDIGVTVHTRQLSITEIIKKMYEKNYDMLLLGWDLPLGPYYLYTLFHSDNDVKGGFNIFGYNNQEFDTIIENEHKERDREKRKFLVYKAQEILAEDLPCIPLYCKDMIEVYRNDRVKGWVNMIGGIMNRWSFNRLRIISDEQ